MPMRTVVTLIFATLLAPALPVFSQEKKDPTEPTVYKVEFIIHDGSDAAAKAGRRYTILIETGGKGTFRAGNRVPYATGSLQPGPSAPGVSPLVATQYQYVDTGVNIDCRLRDSSGKVSLNADIDVSTVVQRDQRAAANPPNPTVASIRIGVNAVLSAGKPTLVASIDDPVTMRKFDVEARVIKVN